MAKKRGNGGGKRPGNQKLIAKAKHHREQRADRINNRGGGPREKVPQYVW